MSMVSHHGNYDGVEDKECGSHVRSRAPIAKVTDLVSNSQTERVREVAIESEK